MSLSLVLGLNALVGALFLLAAFLFLATRQLAMLLETYVRQAVLLAAAALLEAYALHSPELLLVAVLTIGSKALLIPWVLRRNLGETFRTRREVALAFSVPTSLFIGLVLTGGAYFLTTSFTGHSPAFPAVDVPVGLASLLVGMYTLALRREVVPQFLGLLMVDNAVFFAGISLAHSSAVWEVAAALEALLLTVIVTLLTRMIAEHIGSTRVESMTSLREEGGL